MVSPEAFEKFIQDIQNNIEQADKNTKQKAQDTLKAIAEGYRQRISERIANELAMSDACRKNGDDQGARHHEVLAEIYKSLFNIQGPV